MTAPTWHFKALPRGIKIREPVNGEFFATDAISNPGEALVREGIQNSLDAALEGKTVLIRVYLSGDESALTLDQVLPFTEGMWDHLEAKGNGLNNSPARNERCAFLVFEDFGTTGLTGDPSAPYPPEDSVQNPFFYFFRAEGRSGKGKHDLGRWGIGKQVFPRASRVSTVFGFTVRADDQRCMLMGQTVLKSHWANEAYYQDGYFGELEESLGMVMPTENRGVIGKFAETYGLQRGWADPGLSLVVPWCDAEIDEEWIMKAVLRDYFYPILQGRLEVIVETPSVKAVLDSHSIRDEVGRIGGQLAEDINPVLDLAKWAQGILPDQVLVLSAPPVDRAIHWSPDLFSEETIKYLRDAFTGGERIAISVPVTVRKKNVEPKESSFRIYMSRDENDKEGRPIFIREGIIISDVHSPRTPGVRSMVVVENGPLASMLGDSENPAHTQWQKEGSNFKGKYIYGSSVIEFVIRSVREIVRYLTASSEQEDRRLLVDIFSLPAVEGEEDAVKSKHEVEKPKSGPQPPPGPPILPPSMRRVRVSKITSGFSVLQGELAVDLPAYLDVAVAYDVRKGSAFAKYSEADFDLERLPIIISTTGLDVVSKEGNRIKAKIESPNFRMSVTGFDERRDLRVRADIRQKDTGDGD